MVVVFLGPPGCGKGTQAQFLRESGDFLYVATGDLIRSEIEKETDLGKEIKGCYEKGALAPDLVVEALVEKTIAGSSEKSILFDGFPRRVGQVSSLCSMLDRLGRQVDVVLNFSLPDDVIVSRVLGRLICSSCRCVYNEKTNPPKTEGVCDRCENSSLEKRSDDAQESLLGRLRNFHGETDPVKDLFRELGVFLVDIDANQSVVAVRKQVSDVFQLCSNKGV